MFNDVQRCYMCKIGEIGDFKLRQAYEKLCVNGVLKDEYKVVKDKGLTCALYVPNVSKTEWIKIVLSCVHDKQMWFEFGPMKITK